jgi:hypothetical protein
MGCLKLEYQPQERVLEENTLFFRKGSRKERECDKKSRKEIQIWL